MLLTAHEPLWGLSPAEAEQALGSGPGGLSRAEAERRLARFGPNLLPRLQRRPLALRFADQLLHFMALLLWAAGGLAFLAGTPELGWAIWAVVLINGLFSFWQEFQAERTLEALTKVLPQRVRVVRDGQLLTMAAERLVPGDRLALEEGDRVPADCRVLQASSLYLDVAVLTGESLPVARQSEAVEARAALPLRSGRLLQRPGELPLEERVHTSEIANLLPAGATVAAGRGEAIVYATGSETEFGQVARLTASTERSASSLELEVGRIVRTITSIALAMGLLAFGGSLLFVGMEPLESLVFAIGIIVANVPEGLLPTVTLALALNVQRMARRQALVRRLSAVESLGSVTVICSDKTGTLTANRMELHSIWLPAGESASGRSLLLGGAALCSNARLNHGRKSSEPWRAVGDPTETALLEAAATAGLDLEALAAALPRRRELPFDSHRRMMSVLVEPTDAAAALLGEASGEPSGEGLIVFTKGAPLEVLRHCSSVLVGEASQHLDDALWKQVVAANDNLARQGMRVLAVAQRRSGATGADLLSASPQALEQELELVGLVGLYDPPRAGVAAAVRSCHQAGIKVTMVTGDYGLTAQAIGHQIGLLERSENGSGADPVRVINGDAMAQIPDVQLHQLLKYRSRLVFARMAPEQKLRLVQAYRSLGEVVAVTGDGVNDAPALRAADVGLAMGQSGTDVAREAADIVLLDDDFSTIVTAIGYGRGVVANIRKFLTYILASNVPEIAPFLAMVALQIPAALSVLQILAVDLGTDLLPALGLGAEPQEAGLMQQPPRHRHDHLLNGPLLQRAYLFIGLIEALAAMGGYLLVWRQAGIGLAELQQLAPALLRHQAPLEIVTLQQQASSVAFATIVSGQIGALQACRSELQSLRRLPWWRNRLLWLGVASELLLLALLTQQPVVATVFGMAPLPPALLGWVLAAAPLVLLAEELRKALRRRHHGGVLSRS
ncbi:MAG: cation-transporting P-type ATPase [Prochlorococcaceae cyanobacterium]